MQGTHELYLITAGLFQGLVLTLFLGLLGLVLDGISMEAGNCQGISGRYIFRAAGLDWAMLRDFRFAKLQSFALSRY